jgi:hypothetical protein
MDLQERYLDLLPTNEIQPIVIMTEESFDHIINYTCFSSLICCTFREKYSYKPIKQDDNTPTQISV